jgi:NAD(P) transhydrogenase subunit alpha
MAARLGVARERRPGETRAALTPETARKLGALGLSVAVETGAGEGSSNPDADYLEAGASVAPTAEAAISEADVVLAVRAPDPALLKPGATLVAMLNPYGDPALVQALAERGVTAFAMEFVPRITRAQAMDVLSSQANLAGYRAVIEAAAAYGKGMPMMMTAAGTVAPAKVFVMGAGVAGLQAIATARRLGAVVTATDVRPAAKEQVESLGAKFVAVQNEEFRSAETSAGYAREMSPSTRPPRPRWSPSTSASRTSSSPPRLSPGAPRRSCCRPSMSPPCGRARSWWTWRSSRGATSTARVPTRRW